MNRLGLGLVSGEQTLDELDKISFAASLSDLGQAPASFWFNRYKKITCAPALIFTVFFADPHLA